MAWNISTAKRRALVKLQLRDKKGRFIEMGKGVKWYSARLKANVGGTVVGTKGENALVRLDQEHSSDKKRGDLVTVPALSIEVVDDKATLPGKKSHADTPEFEEPEAVAKVEPSKQELRGEDHPEYYAVTETPDGNTYISRRDDQSIYSPARDLQVGDELFAPHGADPTKPFSIGRGWATKGAERVNTDGPTLGKVIAVSENRYAVVQMAGGHTIEDRHNPGQQTDTVTVGLSNQVIRATPAMKEAFGDKLGDTNYGARPADEDAPVDENAPEAQSDHVGREVEQDRLGSFRISGAAKDELQFGIETMESDGVDPGLTLDGGKVEIWDIEDALRTIDGPLGVLNDNLNTDGYEGSHKAIAKAKQRGLQKLRDSVSALAPAEAQTDTPNAPEDAPEATDAPSDAPETAPTLQDAPEAPEDAPEAEAAPVDAPAEPEAADEPSATPTDLATLADSLAQMEQDIEDIDSHNLAGEDLQSALEEAKHDFIGADGTGYTVSAVRDGEGEWSYNLTDETGTDKGNWIAANYDSSADIAKEMHDSVNGTAPTQESTPESAPEVPKAVSYNENGLTAEEQATVTALTRMIGRAETAGQFERADALSAQMADIVAAGEKRKNGPAAQTPDASPEPETAPESAPEDAAVPLDVDVTPNRAYPGSIRVQSNQNKKILVGVGTLKPGDRVYPIGTPTKPFGDHSNYSGKTAFVKTDHEAGTGTVISKGNGYTTIRGEDGKDYYTTHHFVALKASPELDAEIERVKAAWDAESAPSTPEADLPEANTPEISESENQYKEVNSEVNGDTPLALDDPRQMAWDSAQQNVADTERETGMERGSAEWYDLFMSSYNSALEDNQTANADVPESTTEAEPQAPLVEGQQDELQIPGVRKQLKRDDKSKQHLKALDKLEEGDRVSHTNARGETSTYQKHADGTWDQIDPTDDFPEDSPIREAIPASEVADIHKRGDLVVSTVAQQEEADNAPTSATPAPSAAPEADAPATETPSEVQYSRVLAPDVRRAVSNYADEHGDEAGFRVVGGSDLEVTDLDKAQKSLRDLVLDLNSPTATGRNANISNNRTLREARSLLARINDEVSARDQRNNESTSSVPESNSSSPQDETTAKADAALEESMPSDKVTITFAMATSGLDQAIVDAPELLTPEESDELKRLNYSLAMAQHNNHSVRERIARQDIVKLAQQINDRINSESTQPDAPEESAPEPSAKAVAEPIATDQISGKAVVNKDGSIDIRTANDAPKSVSDAEKADKSEPEPQEKVDPISDEQAGRLLKTLTSDNPLPEGIERHVPEAVEGEDYAPTQQQQDVIDAVLGGLNTLVQAKAGAGKTSTLRAIARRLKISKPDAKIGYIAFNKSVQLEANGSMPDNTEARTGHSVAVAWAPEWMTRRTKVEGNISRPSDVASHLGIYGPLDNNGSAFSPNSQAMAVKRTLGEYANSADDAIGVEHLPSSVRAMPEHIQNAILQHANTAWADMKDRNGKLRMSLDQIRKQWALSKPDFSKPGSGLSRPVSVLFLDEAQDTPPVLAKVIADQKNVQKVIVGDADQAIYGFTGATDYLSHAEGDVELPLNKSWRFGPAVADMGNRFLQIAGSPQRVIGGGDSSIVQNMENADAVLVRSNGGMLSEIASELERGRTVGVPAKTKEDLKSLIETARYLRGEGRAPFKGLHEDLADFRSWGEFLDEVDKGDDQNLSKIARMIDTFGLDKMEELIDSVVETGGSVFNSISFEDHPRVGLIARGDTFPARAFFRAAGFRWVDDPRGGTIPEGRQNAGQREKVWAASGTPAQREQKLAKARELGAQADPDVVISTAHKAKGLEWDRVRIGDDFWAPKIDENTGEVEMVQPEELRLNYVAVTRAAKELDLGSLAWVLDHSDENGGDPSASRTGEDTAPSLQSSDEDTTKSPVKGVPDENVAENVAPEEAPEEAPAVTEDNSPEAVAPEYNEDGLTETEQSMLDYFNRRLAGAYQNQNSDSVSDLEREIDGLMAHGERRVAGEALDEYAPTPVEDEADEKVEAPAEVLPEPVPMGRRPRGDYSGVILKDANGNDLAFGDTVGHRTYGPVQISGIVAGSGRVQFINPQTGRTSSVDARRVTRIDGDSPAEASAPEGTSAGTPTEPGSLFIDPSTGQKAFIDKNGNKVVHGDRVVDRRGNVGEVVGVYRAADGKAWPSIKFDDGSTRRIKGHLVSKEGSEVPVEVAPTAPETVPEAPSAPEVAPEAPSVPEVPETIVDTPETAPVDAPEGSSLTGTRTEIHNTLNAAPIGSTVLNTMTGRLLTKLQDNVWGSEGVGSHTSLDLARSASIAQVQNPFALTLAEAPAVEAPAADTPSAPAVDATEAGSRETPLTSSEADRRTAIQNAPVGSTIKGQYSQRIYTRQENGWYSNTGVTSIGWSNEDMVGVTDPGSPRGTSTLTTPEVTTPDVPEVAPVTLNGFDNTTRVIPANNVSAAIRELDFAEIGATLTTPSGRVFTKSDRSHWTSEGIEYSSSRLATLATAGGWSVAEPVQATPMSADEPLPHGAVERLDSLRNAPVGTVLGGPNQTRFVKQENGTWLGDGSATGFSSNTMSMLATADETWTFNPTDSVSVPDASAPTTLPDDEAARLSLLESMALGSTVSKNNLTYTKVTGGWESSFSGSVFSTEILAQSTTGGGWDVVPANGPFTGGPLSGDADERAEQIASLPVGSTVTGGRSNRVFVRRGADLWSPEDAPGEYYNDSDMDYISRRGRVEAPVAALPAPEPEGVHPGLSNGSFIPNAEGSNTGMRRVGDDKWEMIRNGEATGRFATDDMAQMLLDMSDTQIEAPKADLGVDLGVSDLGLDGKSLGDWITGGGRFTSMTPQQRANLRAGYDRFVNNLNTNLPAGVEAKIETFNPDYGYGQMKTVVSFYRGSTKLGSATRMFGMARDARTSQQVSSVDHAYYTLNSREQGGGISSAFLKASKQFYRQLGIDRITIHANIDVGGYAWARGGFDFSSYSSMRTAIEDWKSRANWNIPAGREAEWREGKRKFDELIARATEENFRNGTHPSAIEFSEIGRPEGSTGRTDTWYGKNMMLGSDWFGTFPLGAAGAPSA